MMSYSVEMHDESRKLLSGLIDCLLLRQLVPQTSQVCYHAATVIGLPEI